MCGRRTEIWLVVINKAVACRKKNRIKSSHRNGNQVVKNWRRSNHPGSLLNSLKYWTASLLIGPWDSTAMGYKVTLWCQSINYSIKHECYSGLNT